MAEREAHGYADGRPDAGPIIAQMREAVGNDGERWFSALLGAVKAWPLVCERVGERDYRYLVGGEAFDWLLLAERLCGEIGGAAPEREVEDLLFRGRLPDGVSQEELAHLMGAAKYRAHLNFFYGVQVEGALQLAVQGEVHKERLSRVWENGHVDDDEVCRRIYGATRPELLETHRSRAGLPVADRLSLSDLTEFTYWLFRHRVQNMEPARVASDTRKGLAMLRRMEARRGVESTVTG
jgi:hypothetical protein